MVNEKAEPHGDFSYSRWQFKKPKIPPNEFPYESANRQIILSRLWQVKYNQKKTTTVYLPVI